MKKTLLLLIVTLLCATNLFAQSKRTQIIFKFEGTNDMLLAPFAQNSKGIKRACMVIRQNPNLPDGSIKIEGYCTIDSLRKNNIKLAAIRSNRVKSEFITKTQKVTEKNFITKNYNSTFAGMKNVVVVTINTNTTKSLAQKSAQKSVQKSALKPTTLQQPTTVSFNSIPTVDSTSKKTIDIMNNSKTPFKTIQRKNTIDKPAPKQQNLSKQSNVKFDTTINALRRTPKFAPAPTKFIFDDNSNITNNKQSRKDPSEVKKIKTFSNTESDKTTASASTASQFYLKANLLKWITLTPDIGLEWKYDMFSVALNAGSTIGRIKLDDTKIWGQWYVKPQFKIHLGKNDNWYVGLGYNYGNTNYMYSHDSGKQGTHQTASVIAGYKLPIGKSLSLDFNIGAGYINWDYENYIFEKNIYISTGSAVKQAIGLTDIGVTLMWKFNK